MSDRTPHPLLLPLLRLGAAPAQWLADGQAQSAWIGRLGSAWQGTEALRDAPFLSLLGSPLRAGSVGLAAALQRLVGDVAPPTADDDGAETLLRRRHSAASRAPAEALSRAPRAGVSTGGAGPAVTPPHAPRGPISAAQAAAVWGQRVLAAGLGDAMQRVVPGAASAADRARWRAGASPAPAAGQPRDGGRLAGSGDSGRGSIVTPRLTAMRDDNAPPGAPDDAPLAAQRLLAALDRLKLRSGPVQSSHWGRNEAAGPSRDGFSGSGPVESAPGAAAPSWPGGLAPEGSVAFRGDGAAAASAGRGASASPGAAGIGGLRGLAARAAAGALGAGSPMGLGDVAVAAGAKSPTDLGLVQGLGAAVAGAPAETAAGRTQPASASLRSSDASDATAHGDEQLAEQLARVLRREAQRDGIDVDDVLP